MTGCRERNERDCGNARRASPGATGMGVRDTEARS